MYSFKETLINARDWVSDMRDSSCSPLERARYSCQLWNMNQILNAIKFVEKLKHKGR